MTAGRRYVGATAVVVALAGVFGASAQAASPLQQPSPVQQPVTTIVGPAAAPPSSGGEASNAPAPSGPGLLSNERTSTTWAHPVEEAPVLQHPAPRSRVIAHTRLETEDGFPEVYMLLSSLTDSHGREWVRMRIPGRPNGRIGWISRSALGEFHVTHWLLEISISGRWLKAYTNGRLRLKAPVGVGKPSSPTPTGRFWIRERFKLTDRSNPYWPYALGTSDYSRLTDWPGGGVVGIHGDFGEPRLIPGDPSHGCVRMHAGDLNWRAPRVPIGTPVRIIR
jgi:hypothetical protein